MAEMTITEFASKGGKAIVAQRGIEYMKELSAKAAAARRKKKLQKEA